MEIPPQFTRAGLADFCKIDIRTLDRHIKADTLGLKSGFKRIPGMGLQISGSKAKPFIQAMQAKRRQPAA